VNIKYLIILIYSGLCLSNWSNLNNSSKLDNTNSKTEINMKTILKNITWYGQSCIRIQFGEKIIWLDPHKLTKKDNADFIFITHSHFDHLDIESINQIFSDKTHFYGPEDCMKTLKEKGYKNLNTILPNKKLIIENFEIETIPAYNITKTDFHPKINNWLGYIFSIEETNIYFAGDTELIPEMKTVNCNIIFLPLGQTYTMNSVEDAVKAVKDSKAIIAVPFHFGMYEGTKEDAAKFKELLQNKVEVIIPEIGKSIL